MNPLKATKAVLIGGCALGLLWWATSGSSSHSIVPDHGQAKASPLMAQQKDEGYVGSESCEVCHEEQSKNFSHTTHAKLSSLSSWKGKVTGCEQCHGPGKAHVELESDPDHVASAGAPTKIISFKHKSSKETSETCLACHAGKEEHNNFRRGEHWRNDVGCTDCHSPHGPSADTGNPGSNTFISEVWQRNLDSLATRMLKTSEPQLCLRCHAEQKAQFNMPFHHRVLEGTMKCSDCHNPHGGFELKQTRLTTGADTGCLKCHTDKQGPFVFEHAPLKTEGCTACHTPHGSSNPKLLIRSQVRQLCLECHSNAHEIGAPNTPSFHNQATARFQNCTTCHVKIHGSHIDRFYFR